MNDNSLPYLYQFLPFFPKDSCICWPWRMLHKLHRNSGGGISFPDLWCQVCRTLPDHCLPEQGFIFKAPGPFGEGLCFFPVQKKWVFFFFKKAICKHGQFTTMYLSSEVYWKTLFSILKRFCGGFVNIGDADMTERVSSPKDFGRDLDGVWDNLCSWCRFPRNVSCED